MVKLRTALSAILKTIHPRVYFNKASETATMPYIVYSLPNSFAIEEQDVFSLDVDVWDDEIDTTAIETIAHNVWVELHSYKYIDASMQFSIKRSNRIIVTDEDPRINRRKLIFQLKYYDREL